MSNFINFEKHKVIYFSVLTVMLFITMACLVLSSLKDCPQQVVSKQLSESEVQNEFPIVPRDEWLAEPPIEQHENLVLPVQRVIIAHTATENCDNQASCAYRIRMIQYYQMDSRNMNDIIYNFLVGGDGRVYEGRGWDFQGAHTKGYNTNSICVAFIGTFTKQEPLEKQLNASKWLLEEGVRLNKLTTDYRLYGARQFIPTESPGSALYEIIKKWPHFSNTA